MARKPEIQYIRYYTDGSAAKQLEPKRVPRKRPPVRRPRQITGYIVHINPLPVCGIAVAVCLLIMMAVGISQLESARSQVSQMEAHIQQLEASRENLQAEYAAGYDLEEIERQALLLGMIPAEQAQQYSIILPAEPQEQPLSLWEHICGFFRELMA